MQIQNAAVTGSLTLNGTDISNITGSSTYSASFASQLTSLNTYTGSNNTNISALHAFSSSILTYTASNDLTNATQSNRLSALEVTTGSLNIASGSAITRLNALETTTGSLNTASGSAITRLGSLETASGSAITRLNSIELNTGSYATTGSNTFVSTQYISCTSNPTGFTTAASLYTDGGLRVTKDAYVSGTLYLNNVTVYGTQSVNYITSSQLDISDNIISVNTATPSVRFGGLAVYDSGSTSLTGSMLWDSQNNNWIYSNPSGSGLYDSSMVIMGPRNSGSLGNEQGLNCNYLIQGHGSHHTTSSMIYHDSSVTCIPNAIVGGSSACFTGNTIVSTSGNTTLTINGTSGVPALSFTNTGGTNNIYGGVGSVANITLAPGDVNVVKIFAASCVSCFAGAVCVGGMVALTNQTFGTPSSESAFRIRLSDNGGVNNDPGIGLDGASGGGEKMWFNTLGGFYFNFGTNGSKINIDSAGITTFSSTVCVPTLESCGVINIQQRCFGGSAGLNIIGCNAANNYPNIGFSMQNTCNLISQGVQIEGTITSNTCGSESMGLDFYTKSSGTLSKKFTIYPAGVSCFASTLCAANLISTGQICSSGDGKNLDIGGVAVFRGNGSAYQTHYFTTGAVNVAAYYQYNASGTNTVKIAAGEHSYFNSGCPVTIGTSTVFSSERFGALMSSNCSLSTVKAVARFMNDGSGYIPKIIITDNNIADATISFIPAGAGTSTLSFGIQGVCVGFQYLNIKENGYVGIGVTTPNEKLTVVGNIESRITTSSSTSNYIRIGTYTNGAWGSFIRTDSNYAGTLDTNLVLGTSNGGTAIDALTITTTGNLIPGGNGTQNLGSSSCRWCTVYTSDLSLNNGIGNYTIVEGENDLFLYNNNSCKVFKFIVQEVCPEIAPAKRSI